MLILCVREREFVCARMHAWVVVYVYVWWYVCCGITVVVLVFVASCVWLFLRDFTFLSCYFNGTSFIRGVSKMSFTLFMVTFAFDLEKVATALKLRQN